MPGVYVVLYLFLRQGFTEPGAHCLGWLAGPGAPGCSKAVSACSNTALGLQNFAQCENHPARVPMLVRQIFYWPSHFPSSRVYFDSLLLYLQKFSLELAEPNYSRNSLFFLFLPNPPSFVETGGPQTPNSLASISRAVRLQGCMTMPSYEIPSGTWILNEMFFFFSHTKPLSMCDLP